MTDTPPPVPPVPSAGTVPPPPAQPYAPQQPVPPSPYGQQQPYAQQPYGAQPYAQQPYAYGPRTNTLSIVALVLAFVVPLGAIICGHIALSQIRRTGEAGHGLALAGTVLGYVFTGLTALFVIVYVIVLVVVIGAGTYGAVSSY
ncbi:MAG TPA: DUF4190 domain-containing protein [Pseudolysinimonas sp.]|nr:DUF4190 domain-containing protein [Pseudolysinimonas sp.]